jgi:hypothetical protein
LLVSIRFTQGGIRSLTTAYPSGALNGSCRERRFTGVISNGPTDRSPDISQLLARGPDTNGSSSGLRAYSIPYATPSCLGWTEVGYGQDTAKIRTLRNKAR